MTTHSSAGSGLITLLTGRNWVNLCCKMRNSLLETGMTDLDNALALIARGTDDPQIFMVNCKTSASKNGQDLVDAIRQGKPLNDGCFKGSIAVIGLVVHGNIPMGASLSSQALTEALKTERTISQIEAICSRNVRELFMHLTRQWCGVTDSTQF